MTRITLHRSGGHFRLTAQGHATGSGPTTGSPVVCAAVSAIVFALGGYLKYLEGTGEVALDALRLESGDAELAAHPVDPRSDAARHPFAMAAVGLLQLAEKYPENIFVNSQSFFQITGGDSEGGW